MDAAIQTSINTLRLGDAMVANRIATMDDDAARRRVAGDTNPIVWLTGHLLASRNYLLGLFGDELDLPSAEFLKKPYDPSADYPAIADIAKAWGRVSEALFAKMEQASDDHYTMAIDWNLPNGDKTVRGAILFYTYHEAWHLGQIAYSRKGMGMDGLIPF